MALKILFNIPINEVRKQLQASKGYNYDKDLGSINPNFGTLVSCIEGV